LLPDSILTESYRVPDCFLTRTSPHKPPKTRQKHGVQDPEKNLDGKRRRLAPEAESEKSEGRSRKQALTPCPSPKGRGERTLPGANLGLAKQRSAMRHQVMDNEADRRRQARRAAE
jgi:hypothetical protein